MSLKQMRFQVTSKLIRPNSWIAQTVRQRIPNCWARNGESTSAESAATDGRTDGRIPHWDTTPDCRHVAGVTWWTFSRPCPSTWLPDFLFSISLLPSSTVHVYPIYHSKPQESLFFRDCQIQPRFYSVGSHDYFQSLLCLSICSIDLLDHNDRFLLYTCFTLGYH